MLSPEVIHTSVNLLSLAPFFLAFSVASRQKIHERDNDACVMCGAVGGCECAHIDHNRDNSNYDDPSNGRLLCKRDHYLDHLHREGRNGLTRENNLFALQSIWARLTGEEREGLEPPPKS